MNNVFKYQFIGKLLLIRQIGEPVTSARFMWDLIRAYITDVDVESLVKSGEIQILVRDTSLVCSYWDELKNPDLEWNRITTKNVCEAIEYLKSADGESL